MPAALSEVRRYLVGNWGFPCIALYSADAVIKLWNDYACLLLSFRCVRAVA